jgi:hypothetical protein
LEAVEMPLEGDYSTWTYQWKTTFGYWALLFYVNESKDILWIRDIYTSAFGRLKLSDGTTLESLTGLTQSLEGEFHFHSLLSKYFAFIDEEGGVPVLKIYKNGALQQTIDLQVTCGWTSTVNYRYTVSMSYDGKYILAYNNTSPTEIALFKGS